MKTIFKTLILLSIIIFVFGLAAQALAQNQPAQNAPANNAGTGSTLENPLNVNSPEELYGRLIYSFMGISGVIALLMFIIGGFQWMTAAGNAEKVKKGRDTLIWAVFGLILIFASYAILRAIFETLQF